MSDDLSNEMSMTALEYALGTLPADERMAFARQLAADAGARAALADWERKLAPMAAAIEPVVPDASIFRAIEQKLEPVAVSGNVVALRSAVTRWRAAAVTVSALAASLALYIAVKPGSDIEVSPKHVTRVAAAEPAQPTPPQAAAVAPSAPARGPEGPAGGIATASSSRQNENLVVTANGPRETGVKGGLNIQPARESDDAPSYVAALTPPAAPVALIVRADLAAQTLSVRRVSAALPAGSVLRLWLVAPNAAPRAIGALADDAAKLALPRDVALSGATIAASVEPAGAGADAPAGPFVYEGRLLRD